MSEFTMNTSDERQPQSHETERRPPSAERQAVFFADAISQGARLERRDRLLRGPFASRFEEIMNTVGGELAKLGPQFTPEHLMPYSYQSRAVYAQEMSGRERMGLAAIAQMQKARLDDVAGRYVAPAIESQALAPGSLTVPPYCRQERAARLHEGWRSCTNACFRMIFSDIVGWAPSQHVINDQLRAHYGSTVVGDDVYCNMFHTEAFAGVCSRPVMSFEMIGADLNAIGAVAGKLKARSDADVYCMVNLASTLTTEEGVWHAAMLLGTEGDSVVTHDPSGRDGSPFANESKTAFAKRWAYTYNRARLVVAG